jgi:phasin family protein
MEVVQKLSQQGVEAYTKAFGEYGKSWQSLAAEVTDYTKRSFEDGAQTMEKLLAAKSLEQAFEIQSGYAKRVYEDYVAQMTKLSGLYTDIAKDAYKPLEKAMGGLR